MKAGAGTHHVEAAGDLPAYTVRYSTRARQVRLHVTARDGLVVVVPASMRGYDPTDALRARRAWIADALEHFADRRAEFAGGAETLLPSEVAFPATGERWIVEYRESAEGGVRAVERNGAIVVRGEIDDADACLAALQRWLHARARERLLPWLAEEAARSGLSYRRASVRGQRSRWGGCSAGGSITLNRALVFLRPELVRAVMLHELAHLREPNHSARFWRELERLDPDAQRHRAAIRHARDDVPAWAEP